MRRGRSARGYDGVGFRQLTPGERAAMDEARKRLARAFARDDVAACAIELATIHGLLATSKIDKTRWARTTKPSIKQEELR